MIVKFQATDEQIKQFERMCQMNEYLMSETLAKKLASCPQEEWAEWIRNWFQSVRHMGIAAHITSGIKTELTEP